MSMILTMDEVDIIRTALEISADRYEDDSLGQTGTMKLALVSAAKRTRDLIRSLYGSPVVVVWTHGERYPANVGEPLGGPETASSSTGVRGRPTR